MTSLCIILILLYPGRMRESEFTVYRVVLDPGHGGIAKSPMSLHGDRFDLVSGRYLDLIKEGASRGNLHEHAIVYSIAEKIRNHLKLLAPAADSSKFYEMLARYSSGSPVKIHVETYLSRDRAVTEKEADELDDPNAGYRLFDYPDREGKIRPGRLSCINAVKPHLVVSLHLAESAPRDFEGMNPVITPSYDVLHKGLSYLRGEIKDKRFYYKKPYREWFIESETRSDFDWFLNDASLYFIGYSLKKDRQLDRGGFKGYRYNMIKWSYADQPGWQYPAKYHIPGSRYSASYRDFVPGGRFWDRERSAYERYRREGGHEGFGGDNAYASYEIVRYILYSLYLHGQDHRRQKPGKSYISVWIVPLHVNAVSAFIELGYFNRPRDRFILSKKQDEIAEGVAVGIYSLLAGLAPRDTRFKYSPRGEKLDLEKYQMAEGASYFDVETDD